MQHVIRRAKYYNLEPIVCTTIDKSDDVIEGLSGSEGVKHFRGNVNNKLKRWRDCCDCFEIKKFHTVDADDPFFDADLIKKSFALLDQGYDMVCPTESSSEGAATVGYSLTRSIIHRAYALTTENQDTEMMWYFIEKVPGLKFLKLEETERNPIKARLTLDYEEDYWLLVTIQRILGSFAPRKEVDDLFRRNPDLYKLNWFRNQEWKQKQLSKKI